MNILISVALLGPRQVGKTTLARQIADAATGGAKYLDLERSADRRSLDDPNANFAAHAKELIVLDEVQRPPDIFSVLRGQIDERRRMGGAGGKFLILGSLQWICYDSRRRALPARSATSS